MCRAMSPPCCLTWGQTMVEVMKVNATSFKIVWILQQATLTHTSTRDSWALMGKSGSVSWRVTAPFSWVLVHARFCVCVSQSLFPRYCVTFGGSMVVLMATSSKRAYATCRSVASRAPAPAAGHCWPVSLQETLKHSSGSVFVASLVRTSFFWALWASLMGMGFDSKCDFVRPPILLVLLPCPWTWGVFFGWDPTFSFWWLFSSEL